MKPNTAAELIAAMRAQRERMGPPPEGSILDPTTLVANLTAVLDQHLELLKERHPQQPMRWDLDRGQSVTDGPAPRPFDASADPTAVALALLVGYIEDAG
jgi:hypothetical protein